MNYGILAFSILLSPNSNKKKSMLYYKGKKISSIFISIMELKTENVQYI